MGWPKASPMEPSTTNLCRSSIQILYLLILRCQEQWKKEGKKEGPSLFTVPLYLREAVAAGMRGFTQSHRATKAELDGWRSSLRGFVPPCEPICSSLFALLAAGMP